MTRGDGLGIFAPAYAHTQLNAYYLDVAAGANRFSRSDKLRAHPSGSSTFLRNKRSARDLGHLPPCCVSLQSRSSRTTIWSSFVHLREEAMPKPQKDDRELLELLKFELRFLEEGGYGQSPHAARRVSLIFEDSLTCMNFNAQDRTPCSECLLMKFVPADRVNAQTPCRHIPLSTDGETVASLYESGTQLEIEEAVGNWLRATIDCLEQERGSANS